ncbi:GntR family transcriptional regulator [Schaalia sp. lx-100]|uniref:GntR family transcriptional regulator n=1 Tax=Schaalia sp. lx-100 TaxID=2899081 RepID=UPI001E396606|nr:GntR family transcriptional regulator [Schaalia sp. lx-100]MCD4556661.1 GntR family transcriptional regulator [Schaalia sp. lx-100]
MTEHFTDSTPIYMQIAEEIRNLIIRGALTEGDQLMSTTEYSTTYRINPATVGKAFTQLVSEGLVEKRRGIGMFVRAGAQQALLASRRERYFTDVLKPAIDAGLALGLTLHDITALVNANNSPHERENS